MSRTNSLGALAAFALGLALGAGGSAGCGRSCNDRVAAFRAVFAGLPQVVLDEPGLTLQLDGFGREFIDKLATPPTVPIDLPRSAGGVPVAHGFTLIMRADGGIQDEIGRKFATPGEAADELAPKVLGLASDEPRRSDHPVLLALERTAPLRTVAALVSSLAEPRQPPNPDAPPIPPVALAVQLLTVPLDHVAPTEEALPEWMKASVAGLRQQLQAGMREGSPAPLDVGFTCPALRRVIEEAEAEVGGRRFLAAVRTAPPVIEAECACEGVDVERLAAWLWIRHEPWQPVVRGHAWTFGDRNAEVVEFPASATVADLVPVIDARAGKPFRIAVAPG